MAEGSHSPRIQAVPPRAAAGKRLWSLAAALQHLPALAAELAGWRGRAVTLTVEAPDQHLPAPMIAVLVPALVALLRDTIACRIGDPVSRLAAGRPLTARIAIACRAADAGIAVEFSDDGCGDGGAGIRAAEGRLGAIGGAVTIRAMPGQGRIVSATVPWTAPGSRPPVGAGVGR